MTALRDRYGVSLANPKTSANPTKYHPYHFNSPFFGMAGNCLNAQPEAL